MHSHSNTEKNIKFALFFNLGFTVIEFCGGIYGNSIAVISDALHDLGDSFALGAAWFLEKFSKKTRNRQFSYGYRRFSLLTALISAVILFAGSAFVILEAYERIQHGSPNLKPEVILAVSSLSLVVNGLAFLRLRRGNSMNENILSWHFIEDIMRSMILLVSGITLLYYPVFWLDGALSFLFAIFILYNVSKLFKKTAKIFLQSVPENINMDDISKQLEKIDNVQSIHDTHIWSLDGSYHILTVHLVIDEMLSLDKMKEIKMRAKQILKESFGIEHTTIELESQEEACSLIKC